MSSIAKVAASHDPALLRKVDELVKARAFESRSQVIREAIVFKEPGRSSHPKIVPGESNLIVPSGIATSSKSQEAGDAGANEKDDALK